MVKTTDVLCQIQQMKNMGNVYVQFMPTDGMAIQGAMPSPGMSGA